MNKKLIIYPLIILMVFIISKLILNIFHLEYQSWIYYLLIIMLAIYIMIIFNYRFIKAKDKLYTKIFNIFALNFISITITTICLIFMLIFYGYDYKINNEYLVEDTLLQLRPSKELYHYKNFILKSTKAIPINKKGKIEWKKS